MWLTRRPANAGKWPRGNYYWRQNYTDSVAGTDVHDAPDINFCPLVEY